MPGENMFYSFWTRWIFLYFTGRCRTLFKQMIKIIDALKAAFIYYVYNLHICVYQKISSIVKPFSVDVGRGVIPRCLRNILQMCSRERCVTVDKIIHPHGQVLGLDNPSSAGNKPGRQIGGI